MFFAVIGGSGLYQFGGLHIVEQKKMTTPFGDPSDVITVGKLEKTLVHFLPRHGAKHHLPPHKVNYRANLHALHQLGITHILAVNAVGGVAASLNAGDIVIPDQMIDYTYGREHTFSDGINNPVVSNKVEHIDFTEPFDIALRTRIIAASKTINEPVVTTGVYGCTQGPRLETAAEIRRLQHDGCTLVGMTAMPEAALARELNIAYASISIVANMAAGLSDVPLTVEDIHAVVANGLARIQRLIKATVEQNMRTPINPPLTNTFETVFLTISNQNNATSPILQTTGGVEFRATAQYTNNNQRFISLPHNNRIYQADWGYTANHFGQAGQRIGQYSNPLDQWVSQLINQE